MIESRANLTNPISKKVNVWMALHNEKADKEVIKPDAINLILEEHFKLIEKMK